MGTVTDLVGCAAPVQQAPMGVVSGVRLAAAVAEAGAIGTVCGTGLRAERLADLLSDLGRRPPGAVAVNFAGEQPDPDAVALAAGSARLLDFFWADPRADLVEAVHAAGALASWQVGSLAEARSAADAGCDLIAVQGTEAGGHVRGHRPLVPLLEEVLGSVDVPVLAAGGIADRQDAAAVRSAGAAGVRVGTRFLATVEAAAHPDYKRAVLEAGHGTTVVTGRFADCPLCRTSPRARVLRDSVEALDALAGPDGPPGPGRPATEEVVGDVAATAMYAGEGVGRIGALLPAAHVVALLDVW